MTRFLGQSDLEHFVATCHYFVHIATRENLGKHLCSLTLLNRQKPFKQLFEESGWPQDRQERAWRRLDKQQGLGHQLWKSMEIKREIEFLAPLSQGRFAIADSDQAGMSIEICGPDRHRTIDLSDSGNVTKKKICCLTALHHERIAIGSKKGTVTVFNVNDGALVTTRSYHTGQMKCITQLSDGCVATSGSDDFSVCIWRVEDKTLLTVLDEPSSQCVNCLTELTNGSLIILAGDLTTRIWEPDKTRRIWKDKGATAHPQFILAITPLSEGRYMTTSGPIFGSATVWEASGAHGKLISGKSITCIAVNSAGYIAAGSADRTVQILDPDGSLRTTVQAADWVTCLTFLESDLLAVGSINGAIGIWNPNNRQLIATLKGHSHRISSITELTDGQIVTVSPNQTRVWKANTKRLRMLMGHEAPLSRIACLPEVRLIRGTNKFSLYRYLGLVVVTLGIALRVLSIK